MRGSFVRRSQRRGETPANHKWPSSDPGNFFPKGCHLKIPGSVIEKCQHGLYLASQEEIKIDKARYCGFCTPALDSRLTQAEWDAHVAENSVQTRRSHDATSCPKCGSESHYISQKFWQCAECGNEWRPPRHL